MLNLSSPTFSEALEVLNTVCQTKRKEKLISKSIPDCVYKFFISREFLVLSKRKTDTVEYIKLSLGFDKSYGTVSLVSDCKKKRFFSGFLLGRCMTAKQTIKTINFLVFSLLSLTKTFPFVFKHLNEDDVKE